MKHRATSNDSRITRAIDYRLVRCSLPNVNRMWLWDMTVLRHWQTTIREANNIYLIPRLTGFSGYVQLHRLDVDCYLFPDTICKEFPWERFITIVVAQFRLTVDLPFHKKKDPKKDPAFHLTIASSKIANCKHNIYVAALHHILNLFTCYARKRKCTTFVLFLIMLFEEKEIIREREKKEGGGNPVILIIDILFYNCIFIINFLI